MLRPRSAAYPAAREALYSLSYRRVCRRAGFEPATSRFERCNRHLHHGPWRELAGNGRCCSALAGWRCSERSNRHLHHRPDDACASSVERHAGEQAISVPVTTTQRRSSRQQHCAGPRANPLRGPHPGACVKGRIRTRFFHWCEVSDIFTTSVGLAA